MYLQIKITIFGTFNNKGASINIKNFITSSKREEFNYFDTLFDIF